MANEFKLKAKRYEEMLAAPQAEAGVATEEVPAAWVEAYRKEGVLPTAAPSPPTVALMVMKADATNKDATFAEALVDRTVQFGQPYPAITHVELWIGDQPGDKQQVRPSSI